MPSFVVKITPDRDEYVIWSTVVDCPTSTIGTRAETEQYLRQRGEWGDGTRLDRADERGTSALFGKPPVFGWYDDEFTVTNCVPGFRLLRRTNLAEFCRACDRDDKETMLSLTREADE